MSGLTRTIRRSIARKNGTLQPHRGRTPNCRSQIFKQHEKKDTAFKKMLAAMFGWKKGDPII